MKISGVILAAGRSSRMESGNKLLLDYGGRTVIEQVLANTVSSKVSEVIVVTGFEGDRVREQLTPHLSHQVRIVHNPDYERGRAESIKCAVNALNEEVEAALFMIGDKPGVGPDLIHRALERFQHERPKILFVRTPTGRGHPIIFDRSLFEELRGLEGDLVGDEIIARHQERVCELNDSAVQIDIDTPADYQAALEVLAAVNPTTGGGA